MVGTCDCTCEGIGLAFNMTVEEIFRSNFTNQTGEIVVDENSNNYFFHFKTENYRVNFFTKIGGQGKSILGLIKDKTKKNYFQS